jgi:hypothetical protein
VDGLLTSVTWQAERPPVICSPLRTKKRSFTVDELLGWYADVVGQDEALEQALTRLMGVVVNGDLEVVASAVRRAVRARRAIERVLAAIEQEA